MQRFLVGCGFLLLFVLCWFPDHLGAEDHSAHSHHIGQHAHNHTLDHSSQNRVWILLTVYCGLIVAASLVGGWIPNWIKLTHTRMQTLISGVGGLMLGIAVFHLLPHSLEYTHSAPITCEWLMAGLLVMFFLIRAFHFHHHGTEESSIENEHDHDHDGGHPHSHGPAVHKLNWIGVALGLALHTMIDGIALGASVRADAGQSVFFSLLGLGTFLAVLLHKPLDAISITSLMAAGGWSASARNAVNIGFAMMCPLGAMLFVFGLDHLTAPQNMVIGCSLAFSAGVFFCISLGDLLPEVELHSHNRIRLSLALIVGIALAWLIEQTHSHSHSAANSQKQAVQIVDVENPDNAQVLLQS